MSGEEVHLEIEETEREIEIEGQDQKIETEIVEIKTETDLAKEIVVDVQPGDLHLMKDAETDQNPLALDSIHLQRKKTNKEPFLLALLKLVPKLAPWRRLNPFSRISLPFQWLKPQKSIVNSTSVTCLLALTKKP